MANELMQKAITEIANMDEDVFDAWDCYHAKKAELTAAGCENMDEGLKGVRTGLHRRQGKAQGAAATFRTLFPEVDLYKNPLYWQVVEARQSDVAADGATDLEAAHERHLDELIAANPNM